jgi:formamidopyrimidine-DNA glycosylase
VPELPDVEEAAKNLRSWLVNHRLTAVNPPDTSRQRSRLSTQEFARRLKGRKVLSVGRKGKWIIVELSGGSGFAIHLGMTGEMRRTRSAHGTRFSHAQFKLDNGNWVHFVDPRKFGKMLAARDHQELIRTPAIRQIGPDALSELTSEHLSKVLQSRRPIKTVLMDQHAIGGLGNIYATEALWEAKLHPDRSAQLARASVPKLLQAIRKVLKKGLTAYENGKFYEPKTYGRAGLPCARCGTKLDSMTIGNRSSAFCPVCQKGTKRAAPQRAPARAKPVANDNVAR